MVQAEREHQCAEPQSLGPLGSRGEEHARRRREAERGLMVLGEMIAVEAGPVAGVQKRQAIFVLHRQLLAGPVHVVEDSKAHVPPCPSLFQGCCLGQTIGGGKGLGKHLALVMAGLVPAIHVLLAQTLKTWMPGTRPGMTTKKASNSLTFTPRPSPAAARPRAN